MNQFDTHADAQVEAARQKAVANKYLGAIAHRHNQDVADASRHVAAVTGVPVEEADPAAVDAYVERRALARAYQTIRDGVARDLPTGDAAIHALDRAASAAHVQAAEQAMESALPDRVLQRIEGFKVEPQVLKDVEKLLRDGNAEALRRYLLLERQVRVPGGGLASVVELRAWDPDGWPVLTPEELREKYGVARQIALADLVNRTRMRQRLEARGGIVPDEGGL
jgi:hypothetical protein